MNRQAFKPSTTKKNGHNDLYKAFKSKFSLFLKRIWKIPSNWILKIIVLDWRPNNWNGSNKNWLQKCSICKKKQFAVKKASYYWQKKSEDLPDFELWNISRYKIYNFIYILCRRSKMSQHAGREQILVNGWLAAQHKVWTNIFHLYTFVIQGLAQTLKDIFYADQNKTRSNKSRYVSH